MNSWRIFLIGVALFAGVRSACAETASEKAATGSRENLRQLTGAIKAYALLYEGKKPEKLSVLLDEGLVDGAATFVIPEMGRPVPARAEIDVKSDYTCEVLPGQADVLVREKFATHTAGKVLAVLNDGSIQLLDGPSAPPSTPPAVRDNTSGAPSSPNVSATAPVVGPAILQTARQDTSNHSETVARSTADVSESGKNSAPTAVQLANIPPVQVNPNDIAAQIEVARGQNARGEIDAALAQYRAIQQVAPQTPNLRTWLAELLITKREFTEARRLLDEELNLQPRSAWAMSWLGTVELELGHEQPAGSTLRRAVALDPNVVRFRYDNGNWLDRNNQPRRALMEYQTVLTMDSRFGGAYYGLGLSYSKLGRPDLAIQSYQRFLQFDSASEFAVFARQEIVRLQSQR